MKTIRIFVALLFSLGLSWGAMYVLVLVPKHGLQNRIFFGEGESVISDYMLVRAFTELPDPYVGIDGYDRAEACYTYLTFDLLKLFPNTPMGGRVHIAIGVVLFVAALFILVFDGRRRPFCPWLGLAPLALALSAPFLFAVDRENTAIYASAAVTLYLAWFDNEVRGKRIAAAMMLAFAVVLKVSPALFGLLYFLPTCRRRIPDWTGMLWCAGWTAALFFVPYFLDADGLATIRSWVRNAMDQNRAHMQLTTWGFVPISRACSMLGVPVQFLSVDRARIVSACVGALSLSVAMLPPFGADSRGTIARRLFLIVAAIILVPANAFFYVALHFLPVILIWLRELNDCAKVSCIDFVLGICLIVLLQPVQIPAEWFFGCGEGLTLNYQLENAAFLAMTLLLIGDGVRNFMRVIVRKKALAED